MRSCVRPRTRCSDEKARITLPSSASLCSAADALGAEAGDYADAVDSFATQAAKYDAALRDLARAKAR